MLCKCSKEALALGKSHGASLRCVIYNGAWLTFSPETLQTLKPPTVSAIQTSTNYGLNEADKLLQIAGSVCLLLHYLVSLDRCIFSSSYGGQPWQGHTHKHLKKEKDEERSLVSVHQVLYVNFVFDQQNILCTFWFKSKHQWAHLHLWSEWWDSNTIWEIKGPAQVKADWQQYCLEGLHFISRSPLWPQALWQRGQCQYLRMLIKKDKPTLAAARLSSGESSLVSPASSTAHAHAV